MYARRQLYFDEGFEMTYYSVGNLFIHTIKYIG